MDVELGPDRPAAGKRIVVDQDLGDTDVQE